MKIRHWILSLLALPGAIVAYAADNAPGNIVFIGDSITQGYTQSGKTQASYRYQFWKGLVDNGLETGKDYRFSGSQNGAYYTEATDPVAGITPAYRGAAFDNTHEGHFNWQASWIAGRLPVPSDQHSGNRGSGNIQTWLDPASAASYRPDTVFIMLGTNDLYKAGNSDALIGDIQTIVQNCQQSNPNATIYVLSITPPRNVNSAAVAQSMPSLVAEANRKAAEQAASWSTGTSSVKYMDVNTGLSPDGSMNNDNWHPNSQGELIIAGNIMRGLGMESHTAGLQRKSGTALAVQASFQSGQPGFITSSNDPAGAWTFTSATTATLAWAGNAAPGTAGPTLLGSWNAQGGNFTLDFTIRLNGTDRTNCFETLLGNGSAASGILKIYTDRLVWDNTVLYATDMTAGNNDLRIIYTAGDQTQGIQSGYYIWLNGQMIGDGLQGKASLTREDAFRLGAVNGNHISDALLANLAFETGTAYAIASRSVPEPASSLLILCGGAGLLTLRRRPRTA